MQVLKLLEKHDLSILDSSGEKISLLEEIGSGADGQVFNLSYSKIIKLSVLYEDSLSLEIAYQSIHDRLQYLISHPEENPHFAKLYEFKSLGIYSRILYGNLPQRYLLYYYVVEKLLKISEDEKKVFHSLISHEDANRVKKYSIKKAIQILSELSRSLDIDQQKAIFFLKNLRESKLKHLDLHPRNIMKDQLGNFKLIDFDRLQLT